jgi:hypothetical protein
MVDAISVIGRLATGGRPHQGGIATNGYSIFVVDQGSDTARASRLWILDIVTAEAVDVALSTAVRLGGRALSSLSAKSDEDGPKEKTRSDGESPYDARLSLSAVKPPALLVD